MPSRPLRILHIINSLDPREGGTVECVRQIGRSIAQRGHQVEVAVCKDAPGAPWLESFPLKAYPLGPGIGTYSYSPRLRNWLAKNGPTYDAWIVNGLWQYQGFGASRMATALRIPYFVYPHGMLDPWNRKANPIKYLKKFFYWLLVERVTLERANGLVFTSQEESQLAQHYFPTANWKTLVVGNGVADPPHISAENQVAFRSSFGLEDVNRIWLFLSRIHPKKGIDNLLRAFAALPPAASSVVLVIAGDGDPAYVAELKKLAADLHVEAKVRWVGPLYGDDKWQAFSAAELFVLPSHQENFGIVVAEALAVGTPVCTTTGVNIHGIVTRYEAGLVCNDDEAALKKALAHWLALSAREIEVFSRNARRCYEEQFQVGTASGRLLSALETAVASTRLAMGVAN